MAIIIPGSISSAVARLDLLGGGGGGAKHEHRRHELLGGPGAWFPEVFWNIGSLKLHFQPSESINFPVKKCTLFNNCLIVLCWSHKWIIFRLYQTELNTLNRRAAWRTWPLTKLNVPVKIIGGALVLYILADLISFLEIQRLKGKGKGALGKGVLGARQTRGAREEWGSGEHKNVSLSWLTAKRPKAREIGFGNLFFLHLDWRWSLRVIALLVFTLTRTWLWKFAVKRY